MAYKRVAFIELYLYTKFHLNQKSFL